VVRKKRSAFDHYLSLRTQAFIYWKKIKKEFENGSVEICFVIDAITRINNIDKEICEQKDLKDEQKNKIFSLQNSQNKPYTS